MSPTDWEIYFSNPEGPKNDLVQSLICKYENTDARNTNVSPDFVPKPETKPTYPDIIRVLSGSHPGMVTKL